LEKQQSMEAVMPKKKTVQDYLQLPEGTPYQLLNGELVMSPAPNRQHQKLILKIGSLILNWCEQKKIGEVYVAPCDVYLDNENVVQPDIFFFTNKRLHLLSDRGAEGAPDLIIELLSPSNAYYDLRYKLDLYEKYGVPEYFIVDPEDGTVMAYALHEGRFKEQYREKGIIRSALLQTEIKW
jgi:Uma2 family endonuclease